MSNKNIITYCQIVLCAVLLAFDYELFIVDNGFAPAGLSGVATMIQYKTGFSIGYMSLIFNIPLCLLAFFLVDKTFAIRSLVFCLVYSFFYLFLQGLPLDPIKYISHDQDTIYPVILSGVISGLIYGIVFRKNSSTGGTDIISKYINTVNPELNFFYVAFALNTIIAIISFFVYAKQDEAGNLIFNYKPVCTCILYCFISSFIGRQIINGTKRAIKFLIVTSHPEEIASEITAILKHSCTELKAQGAFTHEDKTVIVCVVNKHQIIDFQNILKKYDDTFAFSEQVDETYGNFKKVK